MIPTRVTKHWTKMLHVAAWDPPWLTRGAQRGLKDLVLLPRPREIKPPLGDPGQFLYRIRKQKSIFNYL